MRIVCFYVYALIYKITKEAFQYVRFLNQNVTADTLNKITASWMRFFLLKSNMFIEEMMKKKPGLNNSLLFYNCVLFCIFQNPASLIHVIGKVGLCGK